MPYLDEDILYNNVEEKYKPAKGKAREAYSDVLDTICEMPRADVVPKSEVEELIRENESLAKTVNEASELIRKLRSKVNKSKNEVAREIFEEIEKALKLYKRYDLESGTYFECYLEADIAELKKKYTEK